MELYLPNSSGVLEKYTPGTWATSKFATTATTGEWVTEQVLDHQIRRFFEPVFTDDGLAVVARIASKASPPDVDLFDWTPTPNDLFDPDPNPALVVDSDTNIVYSIPDDDTATFTPCDLENFKNFRPIAYAPYDSDMCTNTPSRSCDYDFALYPFRDPTGEPLLPANATYDDFSNIHRASYPWVDAKGNMLSFFTGQTSLYFNDSGTVRSAYDVHCPEGQADCHDYNAHDDLVSDHPGLLQNLTVMGSWTHGKMVVLDGLSNHADVTLGNEPDQRRLIDIYKDEDGSNVAVEVGSTTEKDVRQTDEEAPLPFGSVANLSFVQSLESKLAAYRNMRPGEHHDVAWTMNLGKGSTVVGFDDYITPYAYIIASMMPASAMERPNATSASPAQPMWVYNGFDVYWSSSGTGWSPFYSTSPIYLQNAATVPAAQDYYEVPAYGVVHSGPTESARIEPVGAGGVHGRGLWLDGQIGATWPVVQNTAITDDDVSWYTGVFIDPRTDLTPDADVEQVLFTFPDESTVVLVSYGTSEVFDIELREKNGYSTATMDVDIEPYTWTHVAFVSHPIVEEFGSENQSVHLFVDGLLVHAENDAPMGLRMKGTEDFGIGAGVGNTDGFVGWVDELKVIVDNPNAEMACMRAHGTMASLDTDDAVSLDPSLIGGLDQATMDRALGQYNYWDGTEYRVRDHEAEEFMYGTPGIATSRIPVCLHDYTPRPIAGRNDLTGAADLTLDFLSDIQTVNPSVDGQLEGVTFNEPVWPRQFGRKRAPNETTGFCLSCHTNDALDPGLKVTAPLAEGTMNMEEDPRRQPDQPDNTIFGNIPINTFGDGRPATHCNPRPGGYLVDAFTQDLSGNDVTCDVNELIPKSLAASVCSGGSAWTRQMAVSQLEVCSLSDAGDIDCWSTAAGFSETDKSGRTWVTHDSRTMRTCAIDDTGYIDCFYDKSWGQSLDLDAGMQNDSWIAVSVSHGSGCAIRDDNTVECFGWLDTDNQITGGDNLTGTYDQVELGWRWGCARPDGGGTLECWGFDSIGQTNPPTTHYDSFKLGNNYGCGIDSAGEIECWGTPSSVVNNEPAAGSSPFVQLSAGALFACARRADGSVDCWGDDNGYGELTVPDGVFAEINSGAYTTCGVKIDGVVECWGDGTDGISPPPDHLTRPYCMP